MMHPFPAAYTYGGLFYTEDTWRHPSRVIDTYEIVYVVEGTVYLRECDTQYTLHKGDLYLLQPGLAHSGWQDSIGKTSFYWIHFTAPSFLELNVQPGLTCVPDHYRFPVMLRQLLHIGNAQEYPDYTVHSALLLLLGELSAAQARTRAQGIPLLASASEYIRINTGRALSVRHVAQYFGYHPDYVSSLFRKHYGLSLKQYINNAQVSAIKGLLLTTNLSIKELASQFGWENENEFIHFYKYHTGISPAKFRAMFVNTHMNNH
jgi:AraC-like DNA-binding protein